MQMNCQHGGVVQIRNDSMSIRATIFWFDSEKRRPEIGSLTESKSRAKLWLGFVNVDVGD